MKKDIKILCLLFLMIGFLSFMVYHQFAQFQKSIQKVTLPEFKMPEPEEFFPEEKREKEFFSPDGKWKLKYPASWQEGGEEMLRFVEPSVRDSHEVKILFLAYKITWQNPIPSYLIVQESPLTNLEKIIGEMKKEAEESGGKIEILQLEKKENQALLEIKYQREERGIFSFIHSKGKIILMPERSYLITVFSPEGNWGEIVKEAENILDSIEILE